MPTRHVRVGAYHLLRQHGTWVRLAADLRLVDDADPSLRTRARGDLGDWLRREAATAYAQPEGETADELRRLIEDAEGTLSAETGKILRFHLGL